jgi:RES domain-containing protein
MPLYRLCRRRYAELTGLGAKRTGGRWNRKGIAALYAAENASLAVVEVLVHLDKAEIPDDYVMLEISVPDEAIISLSSASKELLNLLFEEGHAVLPAGFIGFSVPSTVVPNDRVVVLYPDATVAGTVPALQKLTPFSFDRRLFLPSR